MKKPSEQGSDLAAVFLLGRLKPVQQTSCLKRPTILGHLEPVEQSVERSQYNPKTLVQGVIQPCI
jgi:hypothetical protein